MEIVSTNIMRGPNIWSKDLKKLIVLNVNTGNIQTMPTEKIVAIFESIKGYLPALRELLPTQNYNQHFFSTVKKGKGLAQIIGEMALALQHTDESDDAYVCVHHTKDNDIYNVVYSYRIEECGVYAGKAAFRILMAAISGSLYDINEDFEQIQWLKRKYALGPSTQTIVDAAAAKNIPYRRLDEGGFICFGQGINQRRIRATICDATSNIGVDIAGDKQSTKNILRKSFIPVPAGGIASTREELLDRINDIGFPIAIKPLDGNQGKGVSTNIISQADAELAFHQAQKISSYTIVEKFVVGNDYRFLLVDYKLIAVAKRTPAMVKGDGGSTIASLIDQVNEDPLRGEGHENVLTRIKIDETTLEVLKRKSLTIESILPKGEIVFLKDTANLSTGGTARDVTDWVHPLNVKLAERVARIVGLNICGIDIVAKDVSIPLDGDNGAVIEVNAAPGFRMHANPSKGFARNVGAAVINMLFPENKSARIPIVAVTGTNGKTTTTRLIAHMARTAGHNVGFTTTEGIYLDNTIIHHGDCSGPKSAEAILLEPTVDFAVLECARGGILRQGLGFDYCDVSVVTNISADHLGLKGINTLEELAEVKAVVPRSTTPEGYAVLNADDDHVYNMRNSIQSKIALFSLDCNNERVLNHCKDGGLAAVVESGCIVLYHGQWKTRVEMISDIPITFNGTAECMVKNVLPAILTAYVRNFSIESIRAGLRSFTPSAEHTPGRLNVFHFNHFDVLVDYAHNEDGYRELKKFLQSIKAKEKVGIVAGVGDRRDQDIKGVGYFAGEVFDKIIIRHDKDLRGRSEENIESLIRNGVAEVNPACEVMVIPDEIEAVKTAIENAKQGAFITVCTDHVYETIKFLNQAKNNESNQSEPVGPQRFLRASN